MRNDVFKALGEFPTVYGRGYYEDTELCVKCREKGYKVVYNGNVWAYHYHNRSFASIGFGKDTSLQQQLFIKRNNLDE